MSNMEFISPRPSGTYSNGGTHSILPVKLFKSTPQFNYSAPVFSGSTRPSVPSSSSRSGGFIKIIQYSNVVELICFYVGIEFYPNLLVNRSMARNILSYCEIGRKSLLFAYYLLDFNLNPYNDEGGNLELSYNPSMLLMLLRRIISWPSKSMTDSRMNAVDDENTLKMIDWTHIAPIEKYIFLGNYHFPCLSSSNAWPIGTVSTTSSPFTKYLKQQDRISVTLSSVAYFEICYKYFPSPCVTSPLNREDFAIGLVTSITPLKLEEVLAFGAWSSIAYHCNGNFYKNGEVIKNIEGPRYDVGDIIGCGIVYPPLGHEYGQLFFTKNGEISFNLDLGFREFFSLPWFPVFYLSSLQMNVDFNFGISEPFLFDIAEYENVLLRKFRVSEENQRFYRRIVIEQEKTVKPRLHPALRDPLSFKDHFSTAATMSDLSDHIESRSANRKSNKRRRQDDGRYVSPFGRTTQLSSTDAGSSEEEVNLPHKRRHNQNSISDISNKFISLSPDPEQRTTFNPFSSEQSKDSMYSSAKRSSSQISVSFKDFSPISSFLYPVNEEFDNSETANMSETMSVATSLLVEVASVDEDGIYISYGAQSDGEMNSDSHIKEFPFVIEPRSCTSTVVDGSVADGYPLRSGSLSSISGDSLADEGQDPPGTPDDEWSLNNEQESGNVTDLEPL